VPTVPVQYAVGDTQGAIGFMFQNALGNALRRLGLQVPTVTLVTQTLVDRNDPAFARPGQADRLFHDRGGRGAAGGPARLDRHARWRPRLAAHDRVAATGARGRGAHHRAARRAKAC
jgi:carbamate kinase